MYIFNVCWIDVRFCRYVWLVPPDDVALSIIVKQLCFPCQNYVHLWLRFPEHCKKSLKTFCKSLALVTKPFNWGQQNHACIKSEVWHCTGVLLKSSQMSACAEKLHNMCHTGQFAVLGCLVISDQRCASLGYCAWIIILHDIWLFEHNGACIMSRVVLVFEAFIFAAIKYVFRTCLGSCWKEVILLVFGLFSQIFHLNNLTENS